MIDPQAKELLIKVLAENNLSIQLMQPRIRFIQDGGVVVEQPELFVTFTKAPEGVTNEQGTKEVA